MHYVAASVLAVVATECSASVAQSIEPHLAQSVFEHSKTWTITRSKVSNGAVATVISNFLPPTIAEAWHSELNSTWKASEGCREVESAETCTPGGDGCTWLYTTNSRGSNRKIRSVWSRGQRRKEVMEAYRRQSFAYSKWELTAGHSLYRTVGTLMESQPVREAIASAQWPGASPDRGRRLGNITDYFITSYADGDFLSTHSDGASGSLAWVLHLTARGEWPKGSGGELRFNPGSASPGHKDFVPSFNRLLLFLTRPDSTPHQVLPVRLPFRADPRFGLTGWYMTSGDRFSASTARENEAMRAAASKASMASDVCI